MFVLFVFSALIGNRTQHVIFDLFSSALAALICNLFRHNAERSFRCLLSRTFSFGSEASSFQTNDTFAPHLFLSCTCGSNAFGQVMYRLRPVRSLLTGQEGRAHQVPRSTMVQYPAVLDDECIEVSLHTGESEPQGKW